MKKVFGFAVCLLLGAALPVSAAAPAPVNLSPLVYNTKLVKAEDAPKSFADLLDPKWQGKMVKAHPGYSGTIMTDTQALSQALGWGYFEKLGTQHVMQVQSSLVLLFFLVFGVR